MLVEDNEMNRLVARTVLNNYGADIREAVNGLEGVETLRREHFDLVLMDVQMPEMDGLEATRKIRLEIDAAIPIIAFTANAIKGDTDKCLAAGMNDYVSKPFEEARLIRTIACWLDTPPSSTPSSTSPASTRSAKATRPSSTK
ncbi:response regulator [Puia sp. P3]|uniref:response regulator n=1 Tax=Puia sp. P3 TaxID=3423952 RepID=UPI003D674701